MSYNTCLKKKLLWGTVIIRCLGDVEQYDLDKNKLENIL